MTKEVYLELLTVLRNALRPEQHLVEYCEGGHFNIAVANKGEHTAIYELEGIIK